VRKKFEKAAGGRGSAPLMSLPEVSRESLKILLNYCFCSWRMTSWICIHLKGLFQEVPCFRGVFLKKRRGGRGGAPLCLSHESLKILFNNCFVFLEDDLVEIHSSEGAPGGFLFRGS